jgi:dolichol-phosphate mannosyltransferase
VQTSRATAGTQIDLTFVVPALNEEKNIANTLSSIFSALAAYPEKTAEVIVVDDGSSDRTAFTVEVFAKANPAVSLIKNPRNLGLGASLQVAITKAGGKSLLIVPGDNDMPEVTLRELIGMTGRADMVMCFFLNREMRGRMRNLLSTLFGLLYSTCFDVYPQYINGPCVYPVGKLKTLSLFSTRFSIVAEINVKLLRQGVSFIEVPSYRQVGMNGSTSFSLRNLWETASVFCRLLVEIHVKNPELFGRRPIRIFPGLS